jgi:hypothetical protein
MITITIIIILYLSYFIIKTVSSDAAVERRYRFSGLR